MTEQIGLGYVKLKRTVIVYSLKLYLGTLGKQILLPSIGFQFAKHIDFFLEIYFNRRSTNKYNNQQA